MMRSTSVLSALLFGFGVGACAGADKGGKPGADTREVSPPEDTVLGDEQPAPDSGADSEGTETVPDAADGESDSAAPDEADGAEAADGSETLNCEGSVRPPGCPCATSDDCTEFCAPTDLGKRCVSTCTESCPTGFACILADVGSADPVFLCLPRYAKLCQPCREHVDCQAQGDGELSLCLDYGAAGHFCGGFCSDTNACPAGYTCTDEVLGDGSETKQCVRNDGVCECNALGASLSMATECTTTNALGTCAGERSCGAAGLGACDAPAAVPETCDRVDNDCNGVTDDLPTDVPCTNDNTYGTCPGTAACQGGVPICVGPTPEAEKCNGLDDNCNGVTDDGYEDLDEDGLADCVDPDADGDNTKDSADNCPRVANADQADNDHDNVGDVCDSDDDNDGVPDTVDCAPFDATVHVGATEICDGKDNDCDHATDEGLCDDRVPCTFDYCIPSSGECGHAPDDTACDDHNACTTDLCDVKTGCGTEPLTGTTCQDGDLCTDADRCLDGACVGSAIAGCCSEASDCDDGNPCTRDTCDAVAGTCGHETLADETPCDADGNGCTVDDSCQSGSCVAGLSPKCSVANPCALGACESRGPDAYACVQTYRAVTTSCDDGLFCTAADHCDGRGACVGGGALDCGSSPSGCKTIVCDEVGDTCLVANAPDTQACSDGNGCTLNDLCHSGTCIGGAGPSCAFLADACNDGACHALDSDHYQCVVDPVPAGVACPATNFCTVQTSCDGEGHCGGGKPRDCAAEAGDQCNTAHCDAVLGRCVKTPVSDGTACDDGNTCTQVDTCKNGVCMGAGDACVEEQISTGGSGALQPTMIGLGYGRYETFWWLSATNTGMRSRLSDAHGSRENEEIPNGSAVRPAAWSERIAAQPNGDHVLVDWVSAGAGGCTGPRGTLYDYTGAVQAQGNLWSTCGSTSSFTTMRVVVLALPNGFGYVGMGNGGAGAVLVPAPKEVFFFPPTGVLGVGARVTLVAGSVTTGVFDATRTSDGTSEFLAAWVAASGTDVLARRFANTGQADSGSAWSIAAAGATNTISQVRIAPFTDGKFLVVWEVLNVDGSGKGVYAHRFNADGTPIGSEFIVNTNKVGNQALGEVGVFSDNSFAILYEDAGGDADGYAVKAQRYEANGTAIGSPMTINTLTAGTQWHPTVTVLDSDEWVVSFVDGASLVWTRRFLKDGTPSVGQVERALNDTTLGAQRKAAAARAANGNILVVYESPVVGLDVSEILGKLIDSQGRTRRAEFQLNTYTTQAQALPRVAAASDRFLVVWESTDQDGGAEGVYGQLVDADGSARGGEFRINGTTVGMQAHAFVAANADGTFMVTWAGAAQAAGSGNDIFGAIYDRDGLLLKPEFPLTTTTANTQDFPVVVASPTTGEFIVGWQSAAQDTSGDGVYLRKFSPAGAPLSGEVQVNTTIALDQSKLVLAAAPNGGELVGCWESTGQDVTATKGVYCQRLTLSTLAKTGGEFRPHAVTAGDQMNAAVTYLADGDFVVAWESPGVDSSGLAVQSLRYSATGQAQSGRVVANRTWAGDQSRPFLTALGVDGGFLIGWQSTPQDGSDLGIYFRLMPAF